MGVAWWALISGFLHAAGNADHEALCMLQRLVNRSTTGTHRCKQGSCSPNCNDCGSKSTSYCGGKLSDQTSADAQIFCTPFPAHVPGDRHGADDPFSKDGFCVHCAAGDWKDCTDRLGTYANGVDGAQVWWSKDRSQGCNNNYWVIHGCDHAGLQVGDCMGDVLYIEQLGEYTDPGGGTTCYEGPWPDYGWSSHPGQDFPQACDQSDPWTCHQRFFFEHPGTGYTYSWYMAGWWSYTGWPDNTDAGGGKKWMDCMLGPSGVDMGGLAACNPNGGIKYPLPKDQTGLDAGCIPRARSTAGSCTARRGDAYGHERGNAFKLYKDAAPW